MFRRIGYAFVSFMLAVALLSATFLMSVFMVLGTPKYLKEALDKGGVYTVAIDSALEEQTDKTKTGYIPTDDPLVRQVIKQTVPPERLQSMAENIMDGSYAWLQGKTDKPSFSVDINQVKTDLAANLGAYVQARVNHLPVCAKGAAPSSVDPYTATCVPKGYDITKAGQEITNQIMSSQDFLDQGMYTIDDIKTEQGRPSIDDYRSLPMAYQALEVSVWINTFLAVAAAVGLIFLAPTKRQGLKRIGIVAIIIGGLLILMAWGANNGIDRLSIEVAKDNGSVALQHSVTEAFKMLGQHFTTWWLWQGIVLTLAGVGALVWLHFCKPGSSAKEPAKESPTTSKPSAPKTPAPKPKTTKTTKK